MFNISSSFKNLEGMLMMLALLCCFAKEAISSLQQIAALIPSCLFAVIAAPFPLPQTITPMSAFFSLTSTDTGWIKSG